MKQLSNQQKKVLLDELQHIREEVINDGVTGIFCVSTKPNGEAEHIAFAVGGGYFELLGQVEKCKFDVMMKIVYAEGRE